MLMMEILSEQAIDLNDPPLTVPDVLEALTIVAPGFVKLMQLTYCITALST
jgi:sulfur carrier protein ThiS